MDDGLARTPPMGWNSWNGFRCDISEDLIKETADVMVANGMKDAGYEYVNLDDGWMAPERDADGNLRPHPDRFPGGIKALADYVHGKGLKLGIYGDAGTKTCEGNPGNYGHYEQDAALFASWEVDLLKLDWCYTEPHDDPRMLYGEMHNALQQVNRPIVFSICEWGNYKPWIWGPQIGHLWRTTGDIRPRWDTILSILEQQVGFTHHARPGGWNDPDMLEVGNGYLSEVENRAHFSLWCMLAAPLFTGNDLRAMASSTRNILVNPEVIAVDQDPLGQAGWPLRRDGDKEVWVRSLSGGERAVLLLNRGVVSATISVHARELDLPLAAAYAIRDLWTRHETISSGTISAVVPPHGVVMMRVGPTAPGHAASATTLTISSLFFTPGQAHDVVVSLTAHAELDLTDARMSLETPRDWAITRGGPLHKRARSAEQLWTVTPPGDAIPAAYELRPTALYHDPGAPSSTSISIVSAATVLVPPSPPTKDAYLSDLTWLEARNGAWSGTYPPVQRDRSFDGHTLSLRGRDYLKGLGVHALSEVYYYLGGACDSFSADVGIDDEVLERGYPGFAHKELAEGTVVFQVWADGRLVYDSGVVSVETPAIRVDIPVSGVDVLRLVVTGAGDGTYLDHADWADARVTRRISTQHQIGLPSLP